MLNDPRPEYDNPWDDVQTFANSIFLADHKITVGRGSRIDSFCKLEGGEGIVLGCYVHVASYCHLNIGGGHMRAGDHCFFASGTRVVTGGNTPKGQSMSAASPIEMQVIDRSKMVLFEPYSGTYSGVCVNAGVTFHEGAVAAAGSVVTKSIPAWEIWAGNPAKFLRKRIVGGPKMPAPPILDDDWHQRDADLRATNRAGLSHMRG